MKSGTFILTAVLDEHYKEIDIGIEVESAVSRERLNGWKLQSPQFIAARGDFETMLSRLFSELQKMPTA